MSGKNKTINQVEDELTAALHDCNLDSMVSVDEIERWMQKLDFEDKLTPIKMLTGLLEDHIVEQYILVEKLVNATITINHVLPLPSLDGKTFKKVLKKRKEQNTPTHLHNIQTSIPPRGWFKIYHKALQLMDQKQFIEARKKFDETFRKLLESKTSEREIYRVFGNAGVAYLFSGEPYIGINCFTIATDLNPNYTFATEQLQKVEKGDYNKFIELGLLGKMTNKMEKWDHRPDYLKLDRLMNWPEKKILKKLSSLGITIDKDEFVHMAQTVNKPEDIAEKLFYPKVSDYTEDEDFFWIAACALWNKYCPDEQSLTGFRNTISKAYEYLSNKNLSLSHKPLKKQVAHKINKLLEEIKEYVYTDKKNFLHEWHHTLDVDDSAFELREFLTSLLSIPGYKKKVISIVNYLSKHEPDPYWDYIKIISKIKEGETKGRLLFESIQKNHPYYCYIASDIGLYYMKKNDYDNAENYFIDAIDIIDKRAKDEAYKIDSTFSTIYEDYTIVLNNLKDVYKKKKPDIKQKKWFDRKRKQIEKNRKKLSYSPQNEKMDEMLSELIEKDQVAKAEKSYPMQYYEFLSQFNINFETDDPLKLIKKNLPDTKQTRIHPIQKNTRGRYNGKKIGRNDPCPCGSGKKYKKCCGSIKNRPK